MKQLLSMIAGTVVVVALVVFGFTLRQVSHEQAELVDDIQVRTALLADSFKESIRPSYAGKDISTLQAVIDKFAGRDRLIGLAVYDNKGRLFAASTGLAGELTSNADITRQAMDSDSVQSGLFSQGDAKVFVLAAPMRQDENVVGALAVFKQADYIDAAGNQIWKTNMLRMFVQALIFSLAIALILQWVVLRPTMKLTELVRRARAGSYFDEPRILNRHSLFYPLTAEISKMSKSLLKARISARDEARLRLEKFDAPWTAERLREFIKTYLKDRRIFVISDSQPYRHQTNKNKIEYMVPAGGVVTALEPIMEACAGVWLARGSGDADRLVVDDNDKVAVPPDDPRYMLKRLWLDDIEIEGYYSGFSNEALWPLCHQAHVRPIFSKEDWTEYRKVNDRFAQSLLAEIKGIRRPVVLIQDYHLALVPEMIKKSRADADVGLFWHIPWPSSEAFSICPWRAEILRGMLGADTIGFHIQQYCNNFLETVGKEIEALVDLETFAVTHKGHMSKIKPFPISVAFTDTKDNAVDAYSDLLEKVGIKTKYLCLGVDRMDYAKGILEKLRGVEFFLDMHPAYKGEFTFLQIASPSREGVKKYREYRQDVIAEAERINKKFKSGGWQPIVLLNEHCSRDQIYPLYRLATACIVSSLSDGMNLVAKEFVASRSDNDGVLILSRFVGSARELNGAIIINPYSAEQTAEAIHQALTTSPHERQANMRRMREAVRDYNIYRWAAEFIKAVAYQA